MIYFSNIIDPDIISGNLTATISDHLPQFAIIPNMFGNIPGNKSNIYERIGRFIQPILQDWCFSAKVIPVFKEDSKLDYSNYCLVFLLRNIEKILEKLIYRRLYTILNNKNIVYDLHFGFRH